MRIPAGTIEQQLRAALKTGMSPEEATRHVLGPFGSVLKEAGNDSLVGSARPSVLGQARRLHRQMQRKREDRAFLAAPGSRERASLREMEFHLPDGTVVPWADATQAQHDLRVAWLTTYIGSLEVDMRRHERASKLLAERGAEKLSDIDGWEALIGDELDEEDTDGGAEAEEDASGQVAP